MGFSLKAILEVRITAAKKLQDAGAAVKRDEQDAPPLVLAHVNALV